MNLTSVLFLTFGALVLWGGLALTLSISLRAEKDGKNK
jgi:hypothetical protein